MEEKYILSLDIGTTTIRSYIFNSRTDIVGKAVSQVILHYPNVGHFEIDPDEIWNSVLSVVKESLQDARLSPHQITAMGISTQRGTFTTWSRTTGKPFHRFITWKDLRADKLVKLWNESYTWKTTLRLYWALHNVPELKAAVENNDAMFGTMDTWLLYKMTGGKVHMTDVSSASATGFYDPFTMQWAGWAMSLFGLPIATLPDVVDIAGEHFTSTDASIWGHPIPIRCCIADQSASMWGSCCFDVGDVKLTMGTGTFFNINTGGVPHASVSGFYPIVGWRMGDEIVFSAEGANNDTGSIIKWAQNLGLFDNPEETSDIALSVPDSDGVFFIPAFSGLGPPYNDCTAASGFVGMKPSTRKAHLVRAVFESLAFRTAQLHACARAETAYSFHTIRIDGGVSNNDFVVQLVADLTGLAVERPAMVEMALLGCAHLVGLQQGIFTSKEQLKSLRKVGAVFKPRAHVRKAYEVTFARWKDAAKRMCGWYTDQKLLQSNNSVYDSSSSVTPQNSLKVTNKKYSRQK